MNRDMTHTANSFRVMQVPRVDRRRPLSQVPVAKLRRFQVHLSRATQVVRETDRRRYQKDVPIYRRPAFAAVDQPQQSSI